MSLEGQEAASVTLPMEAACVKHEPQWDSDDGNYELDEEQELGPVVLKEELELGPVVLQPPDAVYAFQALQKKEQTDCRTQAVPRRTCSVVLEPMLVDMELCVCRIGHQVYEFRSCHESDVSQTYEEFNSRIRSVSKIFNRDEENENGEEIDEVELYFEKLTKPKPNVFKGFVRERVCEICEIAGNLVKCKNCHGTFHVNCVKKEVKMTEVVAPTRGRKKKRGRRPKGYDPTLDGTGNQSNERCQDANNSKELNMSIEEETGSHIVLDADNFENQWELKMKELQTGNEEEYASDQEINWEVEPGHCEVVAIQQKQKPIDYSDYKCNKCLKHETPVCFVCKSNKSPRTLTEVRQKCQVAHCHRYYHLECLDHWPQTQFNSCEPSKTNKKVIEYIEALSCPRHVCHTCVSDDPRGCKTRFCGDNLARCVRCPATYHSYTKCLPAGTQILTGSQIICPRHYEHRPGKVPCHVNTGWCFICALGGTGTRLCCEYCPTSFHAECLNVKPPEGSYMCEDCETGRLPLYGQMVWVKLGHYRWWPGIVLHPTEIPDNIMAVKHSPGEFVVRFFGQYDHYWVNRGRVFPFLEGDSGKISSQKSKIDAAFATAMEHARRACEILKSPALLRNKELQNGQAKINKSNVLLQMKTEERKRKIIVKSDKSLYKCNQCSFKSSFRSNLKVHLRIHTGEKPFKCDYCSSMFAIKSNLQYHLRTHTGEKPFKCNHCSYMFTRKDTLLVHLRTHTGEKPFKCNHCSSMFTRKCNLLQHLRTHTGQKPFECNHCSSTFAHKSSLLRHLRTHTGEKPYKCNNCNSMFRYKSSLQVHLRAHTGEKPFKCNNCSSMFTRKDRLLGHLRTHTGEKPYTCNYCNSMFRHKSNLKVHLRTHTGEKPFKCNNCSSMFTRKGPLLRHLRTHTGERPFECNHCSSTFKQKSSLVRHLKSL